MNNLRKYSGFTLIEVMIAIAVLGIIMLLAMPGFGRWIQDSQTRTVADSLQNGIRIAQAEAVSRGRQVAFFVTTDEPPSVSSVASVTGSNWGIRVLNPTQADPIGYIQGAVLNGVGGAVVVTTTAPEIRFNAIGRLANSAGLVTYDIDNPRGTRPLRVVVTSSGSVRMCDPSKTLSATNLDGC